MTRLTADRTRLSAPESITLESKGIYLADRCLQTERSRNGLIIGKDILSLPPPIARTKTYLLDRAVHYTAGDQTSVISPLLGVSKTPTDTMMYVIAVAEEARNIAIVTYGSEMTEQALDALLEGGPCTLEDLKLLDWMWGFIVRGIREVASPNGRMTPEAQNFRDTNVAALDALLEREGMHKLVQRKIVLDRNGVFSDVMETLTIPVVPREQREKLQRILPDQFKRVAPEEPEPGNLNIPARIMRTLGEIGNDYTRNLIGIIEEHLMYKRMYNHGIT